MRWDREKFPEPNLHLYGKDNTKIIVYNMRKWQRRGGSKKPRAKKIKKYITKRRTLD